VSSLADDYSTGAQSWAEGPIRIYGKLASLLIASSPVDLRGRRLLDLGAGTGAASRPAMAEGANVVALDTAFGMLSRHAANRPPGVVGDAFALPLRPSSFDVVVAAFSLNHLERPATGVREVTRIMRTGGVLLASVYDNDDDHPVKQAVEQAMTEHGWQRPAWYSQVKRAMSLWGTIEDATNAVEQGGLYAQSVERREVSFAELDPEALIGWRYGMAQFASFIEGIDESTRRSIAERAVQVLGDDPPMLVRRVIFLTARAR
jgi:SAM-dependent methyltransferase